jgi:hypothetical protein
VLEPYLIRLDKAKAERRVREAGVLPPPARRTVRATCASHGSSLESRPWWRVWRRCDGTRCRDRATLGMHVSVAMGMAQDPVVRAVCATHGCVPHGVVMPACHVREGGGTDGTVAVVFVPQVDQGTSAAPGRCHLDAKALCKGAVPCRVVGVAGSCELCRSGDW